MEQGGLRDSCGARDRSLMLLNRGQRKAVPQKCRTTL
jgi:hypothetical protein